MRHRAGKRSSTKAARDHNARGAFDPSRADRSLSPFHDNATRTFGYVRVLNTNQNLSTMSMMKEFKEFAMNGNVIDLAVGVVIGGAFGKIVGSMVDDLLTPAILTPALKAANLTNLADLKIEGTAIKYGSFLSSTISFIIIAFALFMVIKGINATKKKEAAAPAAPPEPSSTDKLLMEIRDALKK